MGLMVYGTFGRSGVYPLQAVLRAMVGDRPLAEQISFTRRLLANLPSTNLFSRNTVLSDHTGSDAEMVDLLLHRQDRSEERRVGKECVGTCTTRWYPHH